MDIDGYKLCALGHIAYYRLCNAQRTRTVFFFSKELREKVEARIGLFLGLKSAHTDRFSICGNVYDRLDYETLTERLKLCVIYKYGNNVITY